MSTDAIDEKTGGPAFPAHDDMSGITKRDYFAAHALIGLAGKMSAGDSAKAAFDIADKMLAERKK
jgi:hypothetical protein